MTLIEWGSQYLDEASDGFKAELIWWQAITGSQGDLSGLTFDHAEWHAFAAHFLPEHYAPPQGMPVDDRTGYDRAQAWACFALLTGADVAMDIGAGDGTNEAVHKVLWATRFGLQPISAPVPNQITAGLESPDDNEHAMCVLATRLLGHSAELRSTITSTPLTPESYRAVLVAEVAQHF